MRIVDVHNHIFPDDVAAGYREDYFELSGLPFRADPTADSLVDCMKQNGISRVCALQEWQTTGTFNSADLTLMSASDGFHFYSYHDWLGRLQRENPDIVCFGGVHPGEENPVASFEAMIGRSGLYGLKLVPCMQQYRLNDAALMPVYELAQEKRVPVIMHTGLDPILGMEDYGHPRDAGEVATAYPGLSIVMAHMGMPFFSETREVTRACPNVFVDIAASVDLIDNKDLSALICDIGVERVLFGSDFPFCDTAESLKQVEELGLSVEERTLILGENARNILGI